MDRRSKLSGVSSSKKYMRFKAGGTTGMVQYPIPSFRLRNLDSPLSLRVLGYWSSGIRLADSAKIAAQGIETGELPEYMVFRFSKYFDSAFD